MVYKMNPTITIHSVTIELTAKQMRTLVDSGIMLHEAYNGQLPSAFRPLTDLCDDLSALLAQEKAPTRPAPHPEEAEHA